MDKPQESKKNVADEAKCDEGRFADTIDISEIIAADGSVPDVVEVNGQKYKVMDEEEYKAYLEKCEKNRKAVIANCPVCMDCILHLANPDSEESPLSPSTTSIHHSERFALIKDN